MKILFQTRFSFFGKSGWRSEASRDPGKLFDPERLDARFAMFERFTLASLAAQEDDGFMHMVLASSEMPMEHRKRLRELLGDMLGSRARMILRPYSSAGHKFRRYTRKMFEDTPVTQVVLDDDDALSCDFTAQLRHHARHAAQTSFEARRGVFLTFPHGLSMVVKGTTPTRFIPRNVPFTNLGLAVVGPADMARNPYLTSHRRIGERHPHLVLGDSRPFYLRTVHDSNDSRAMVGEGVLEGPALARALERFPFLPKTAKVAQWKVA